MRVWSTLRLSASLGEFSTALTFSLELLSTYRVSGNESYLSDCVKCTITANPVQWCTCWLTTIAWCIVKTVSRNCSSMVALPSFEAVDWRCCCNEHSTRWLLQHFCPLSFCFIWCLTPWGFLLHHNPGLTYAFTQQKISWLNRMEVNVIPQTAVWTTGLE